MSKREFMEMLMAMSPRERVAFARDLSLLAAWICDDPEWIDGPPEAWPDFLRIFPPGGPHGLAEN